MGNAIKGGIRLMICREARGNRKKKKDSGGPSPGKSHLGKPEQKVKRDF